MRKETVHTKDRFSHWTLKELDRWNKMGVTPIHRSQDTESLCAFFGALDVLTWFRLSRAKSIPGVSTKHESDPRPRANLSLPHAS